ncbi:MAG: lysophospholipid acyltransferase family protein [Planctomycetota bacterium]
MLLILLTVHLTVMALWYAAIAPWLRRGPRGEVVLGLLWRLTRIYVRLRHRLRVEGREHLPAGDGDHDGLIVVSNHTSAVDPFLLQAPARFWIRWMMAEDMMMPSLAWAWRLQRVIPVDRTAGDSRALRDAIRHLKSGGCVGVFPEARLVQPPGEIRPFLPGVGLLVARTGKPVLLAWISGTPPTRDMNAALRATSRSQVVFIGRYDFAGERDPAVITQRLREEIRRVSGWRLNDEMLPMGEPVAGGGRALLSES